MRLFRWIIIAFLIFLSCSVSQGQEKPSYLNEKVCFHLGMRYTKYSKNDDKKKYTDNPLLLIIDNQSDDTVRINNFSNKICHKYDNINYFSWEFLTLSNQIPDNVSRVTIAAPFVTIKQKRKSLISLKRNILCIEEKIIDIIIPPGDVFVSDIYISSSYYRYREGYYKLCLYCFHYQHDRNDHHHLIAEMVIKYE